MSIKDSSLFLCSRSSNHHATLSNRLSLASSRNILACPVLSSFPLPPYLESPLDFDCFILRGDQDQTPPPSVPSSLVADIWASLKHPPTSEVRDTYTYRKKLRKSRCTALSSLSLCRQSRGTALSFPSSSRSGPRFGPV